VDRAKIFLRRAGTVILAMAILLWIVAHLPLVGGKVPPIERSLAARWARTIEPVIRPLGFNWKIGVGLITSLAAREVIVGTLGTIYGMQPDAKSARTSGRPPPRPDPGSAVALLVFFAFAMQCMSTMAVVASRNRGLEVAADSSLLT